METLAELPLTGDQVVCLSHEPGRPQSVLPHDELGRAKNALHYGNTIFGEGPGPTRTIRMRNGSRGEGAE
jgi:hypothetical protein